MKSTSSRLVPVPFAGAALALLLAAPSARAQGAARTQEGSGTGEGTLEQRLQRLESEDAELRVRVGVLTDELEKHDLAGPQAAGGGGEEKLSIGGYGEAIYRNFAGGGKDEIDLRRAVLYVGYRFDEDWLFDSELEFEHATTDEGEAEIEFAYLDRLVTPALNFRAGLVLMPVGLVNELHEPTAYLGAERPETETRILPTTWRELGAGAYGDVGSVRYEAYVVSGLKAEGFDATGLREGRQEGGQALAEDLAVVGRLDWTSTPGLLTGLSIYRGDSGQGATGLGATPVTIVEGHVDVRAHGWRVRGLAAMADIGDVARLNAAQGRTGAESVGSELRGAYVEVGYDVLQLLSAGSEASLTPYVRWETVDTQADVPSGFSSDPANDGDVLTVGLQWQPIPRIVLKLDYQDYEDADDRVNLLLGYSF